MNKSKHTTGPWRILCDGPIGDGEPWQATMEVAKGLTIASPYNTEPICRVSGYLQPVEGNAYLIAAAPELLQACRLSLSFLEIEDKKRLPENLAKDGCPLTRLVRSAIAKAEGRS